MLVQHVRKGTKPGIPVEEEILLSDTSDKNIGQQEENMTISLDHLKNVPLHLQELLENGSQHVISEQKQSLELFLIKYQEMFVGPDGRLG